MTWEFDRDDEWQRRLAEKFLDPFYRSRGWHVERYPGDHPIQKLHVDVTLRHVGGRWYNVDEKIIRGLRKGGPAEKINLETWSCSVPGFERRGWIAKDEPNKATVLFVCHAEEVSDFDPESWKLVTFLDCVWIPFQSLRKWFWQQGEETWELFDNGQMNHSIARKVPIDEIVAAVKGTERFRVERILEFEFDQDQHRRYLAGLIACSDTERHLAEWKKRKAHAEATRRADFLCPDGSRTGDLECAVTLWKVEWDHGRR